MPSVCEYVSGSDARVCVCVRYKTIKSKDVKMAHTNRPRITENDLIFEYKLLVGADGDGRGGVECPQEYTFIWQVSSVHRSVLRR